MNPLIRSTKKPIHRPITSKHVKPFAKEVPTKRDIQTYVISDSGKLIRPRSPTEPPPPLKPIAKRFI